jgi:hypothetical protein
MTSQPQNPFYNRIPRNYLNDKELAGRVKPVVAQPAKK